MDARDADDWLWKHDSVREALCEWGALVVCEKRLHVAQVPQSLASHRKAGRSLGRESDDPCGKGERARVQEGRCLGQSRVWKRVLGPSGPRDGAG